MIWRILLKHFLIKATAVFATFAVLSTAVMAQEVITIRFATFIPKSETFNFDPWLDKIVADSEGTLEIKTFYGGTLGRNPVEQLTLAQSGIADMVFALPSFTPGAYPEYGIAELPIAKGSLEGSLGLANAFKEGLLPTPVGVHMIAIYATSPASIHLSKPTDNAFDVDGRKIQAYNPTIGDTLTALDAVPVNVAAQSVAEAISNGVVEGAVINWAALEQSRIFEVAKYHIEYPLGAFSNMLVMNEETWKNLPEAAKASFIKHGGSAFAQNKGAGEDVSAAAIRKRILGFGDHTIINLTDEERAKMDGIAEKLVAEWIAEGEGRQAVYDAFIEGIAKAVQ